MFGFIARLLNQHNTPYCTNFAESALRNSNVPHWNDWVGSMLVPAWEGCQGAETAFVSKAVPLPATANIFPSGLGQAMETTSS